jgi:signal transduction histidine kinase
MNKHFVLLVFCYLFFTPGYAQHQQKLDSLFNCLTKTTNDSSVVKTYLDISNQFLDNDARKALHYNDSALSLLEKSPVASLEVKGYYQRSIIQMNLGNLEEAERSVLRAIELGEITHNIEQQGSNYNRLGAIYENMGQLDKTLKAYLRALELFKITNELRGIGSCLNRIGNFHNRRESYPEAIKYYTEALSIFQQLNNKDQLASVYNNLGVAYFNLRQFINALQYYNRSVQILKETHEFRQLASRDLNIGKVYKELKQPDKALHFLEDAYTNAVRYENKNIESQVHLQKGLIFMDLKKLITAIEEFDKGVAIAKTMKSPGLEMQFYENLSSAYVQLNQFKEAYYFQRNHHALKDSLFTIEKNRQISLMETRFESERKEQTISILKAETKNKSLQFLTLFCIAGLLIVSLVLVVLNYRGRQRTMRLINQQQEELNKRHIADLLKEHELKAIRNLMEGQEQERIRVSKELHDGIGGTLAAIKMNLLKYQSSYEESNMLHQTLERIDEVCQEVRHISHNLAPPEFFNSALTEITKNFITNAINERSILASFEFFPEEEINTLSQPVQIELYRIIQELVMNIIKHANAKHLGIFITHHENYINLMIEDDGIGFDPKNQKNGIGLKSIQNRIQGLNGEWTIDSKPGKGTIVNVDIPTDGEYHGKP